MLECVGRHLYRICCCLQRPSFYPLPPKLIYFKMSGNSMYTHRLNDLSRMNFIFAGEESVWSNGDIQTSRKGNVSSNVSPFQFPRFKSFARIVLACCLKKGNQSLISVKVSACWSRNPVAFRIPIINWLLFPC